MNGTKEFVEIFPSNAASDGVFSRQRGSVILNFQIAEEDAFMVGGSVRLCGKFKIQNLDNTGTPADPNNYTDDATGANYAMMDQRLGAYSFLDMLTISSKGTAQQIEQIRNYHRLMATLLPALHSQKDIDGDMTNQTFSNTDFSWSQTQVSGGTEISFSMRLYSGLFYSKNPIPLSADWGLKGLNVQIQITNPAMALFNVPDTAADTATGAAANGGAFYEMSDMTLQYEQIRPSPEALIPLRSQSTGTFSYNSWTSLYNVINSPNHSATFDLGLRNVVACFMNFLPVTQNNSYDANSFATCRLRNTTAAQVYNGANVNVNQLIFTRGGIKFPNEYVVIRNTGEAGLVHSQTQREFLNSIRPFIDIDHTIDEVEVSNQQRTSTKLLTSNSNTTLAGGGYFGLGVSYDAFSEMGADFSGTQWGYTLFSDLEGEGFEAPHSAYIYFLARQTLGWSPTGLQVIDWTGENGYTAWQFNPNFLF